MKKLKNKNAVSEGTYKKLKPFWLNIGDTLVHKPLKNELSSFRLILEKFLVLILPDITQNEFTVRDSLKVADEILTQDSDLI